MYRKVFSPHNEVYVQHIKSTEKHNMSVWHYHDAYEIYLALDGKRYVFYDNMCYTLQRGDIAIFKPFDIHYAQSGEFDYYERYVVNFNPEELCTILDNTEINLIKEKILPTVTHLNEEQTKCMLGYLEKLEIFSQKNGMFSLKLLHTALFQLIMYVIECCTESDCAVGESVPQCIIDAIGYIKKNYMNIRSVDEIAESVKISKFHLCRTFKQAMGATIFEYLNNVRLTKVHNLLINTDETMEDISIKTGFSTSVNLARNFKKIYGMPPSDFRKANR